MKSLLTIIFVAIIGCACNTVNSEEPTHSRKSVTLLDYNNWRYKESILVSLYSKDSLELLIQLRYLANYIDFNDDKTISQFGKFTDSILHNPPASYIIPNTSFDLEGNEHNKFQIKYKSLFEPGNYFIYNRKSKSYINEVSIDSFIEVTNPQSSMYYYRVYVNGSVFWEDIILRGFID